jgi:hypothetical protein
MTARGKPEKPKAGFPQCTTLAQLWALASLGQTKTEPQQGTSQGNRRNAARDQSSVIAVLIIGMMPAIPALKIVLK